MIDGKEVREINPYLSDEITVASWCPTDGHANPLVATLGFYKRARELGAEFITGEDVLEIQKIKGKARRVVTAENVYEGETIVLASGYESRPIAASVGIDIPMRKELIEALVTEQSQRCFHRCLVPQMRISTAIRRIMDLLYSEVLPDLRQKTVTMDI